MGWEIRERTAGNVMVMELAGRITLGDSGDGVESRLQEIINSGVRAMLLDLSRVEVLDSRGLKALVRAYISMQKRGGQLKLMKPPPRIRQVLEITRLLQVFEVFEDEESARSSFTG